MPQPAFTPLPRAGFLYKVWTKWTKRTPRTYLLLLFLLSFSDSKSTVGISIQGLVADSTGQPLPGAQVRLMELHLSVVAAGDGRYELTNIPAGSWTLEASHISYRPSSVKVNLFSDIPQRFDFILTEQTLTAPEAIVKSPRREFTAPSSSSVILTSEEWQEHSARTLSQVLQGIPGISVREESHSARISLRGAPPRATIIRLDDTPLNDAGLGEADLGSLSLDQIASIEVNFSGMGGTIDLRSRGGLAASTSPNKYAATGKAGSYNELGGGLEVQLNRPYSGLEAAYDYRWSKDDWTYRLDDGTRHRRFNNQQVGRNVGFRSWKSLKSWTMEGGFHYSNQARGIPGLTNSVPTPGASLKSGRLSGSVSLTGSVNGVSFRGVAYGLDYTNRYDNPEWQFNPETGDWMFFDAPEANRQRGRRGGIRGAMQVKMGSGDLNLALETQTDRYHGEDLLQGTPYIAGTGLGEARRETYRAESSCSWAGKIRALHWQITPQLKFEYYQGQGAPAMNYAPSLSAGMSFDTPEGRLNLRGGWGRASTAPPFLALFLVENMFAVGNRNLKPERGETFDFSLRLIKDDADRLSWNFAINSYIRFMEDLIIWRRNSFGKYFPDNVSRTKIKGLEFTAESKFHQFLRLFGSYEFVDSRNDTPGSVNRGRFTPLSARHQGSVAMTVEIKNTELNLRARGVGRRYSTESNLDPISTAGMGLPPYRVVDVSIGHNWNLKWFILEGQMGVENLENRSYRVVERSPMPGRTWWAKVKVGI